MREIEFRGKRVDDGEWVYGGYHKHTARQICPIGDSLKDSDIKHLILQSGFADWNMPKPIDCYEVIPETVGQYTGLKDKNGKEIYEGDIVNAWIDLGPGGEKLAIYVVEITPFGCTLQEWTYECVGFLPEVIGNIHDNPELLEGE